MTTCVRLNNRCLQFRSAAIHVKKKLSKKSSTQIKQLISLAHSQSLEGCKKILSAKHQVCFQAAAVGLLSDWNFIHRHAPHFGGLREAGLKSAKNHLRRTIGNHVLSLEELTTLFRQIEAILKSPPIEVVSDEPKDGEILTPAQLVCGTKLETFATIETLKKSDISN